MSFETEYPISETCLIHIGAALDFRNVAQFKAAYLHEIEQGNRYFVLDFSQTGILDSTGLGAIFYLHRLIHPKGGRLMFAEPSRPVQVVVQLTRAFRFFQQFVTIEEALDRLDRYRTPPIEPIITQYQAKRSRKEV